MPPTLVEDFLNSSYFEALFTAIGNGLWVLVLITLVAGGLTAVSGGPAALGWEKQREEAAHDAH